MIVRLAVEEGATFAVYNLTEQQQYIYDDTKVMGVEITYGGIWLRLTSSPDVRTFYPWHKVQYLQEVENE